MTVDQQTGLAQSQICECFNKVFSAEFAVRLVGGGREPDYFPATSERSALIVARENFAASALHEAAHWCVASRARRALSDYGYEYLPPPREPAQQAQFFSSEARVQAVEWYLSRCAGNRFRASADDPDFSLSALAQFQSELWPLVARWEAEAVEKTVPPRAHRFGQALQALRTKTQSCA